MNRNKATFIAGLGNPGEKYRRTRHNVGFMLVDHLAKTRHIQWRNKTKQKTDLLVGRGEIGEKPVILVKPMTYMNRSGGPLKRMVSLKGGSVEDLIVVHDDMDLLFGRLKIKKKGGDGGHRGLRSILEAFGDDGFIRLRIGIGRPGLEEDAADYVLHKFNREESAALDKILNHTLGAVKMILCEGATFAMNHFNGTEIA